MLISELWSIDDSRIVYGLNMLLWNQHKVVPPFMLVSWKTQGPIVKLPVVHSSTAQGGGGSFRIGTL